MPSSAPSPAHPPHARSITRHKHVGPDQMGVLPGTDGVPVIVRDHSAAIARALQEIDREGGDVIGVSHATTVSDVAGQEETTVILYRIGPRSA